MKLPFDLPPMMMKGKKMEKQGEEIDHEFTDAIVCPWCGCEDHDSWEYHFDGDDQAEVDCRKCREKFTAERHDRVYYTTMKIETKS